MTIDEMHIEITQGVQRLASHIDYDLQQEEIDLHLNHVIREFVLSHFTFTSNGFEFNHKATQDIQSLIKEETINGLINPPVENIKEFKTRIISYPIDYYLPISLLVDIVYTLNNREITDKVFCKRVKQDSIYRMLDDPFNTTSIEEPLFTIANKKFHIYTNNTFDINNVYLTYIKEPAKVSITHQVDCDLYITAHETIVDQTIKRILSIKDRFGPEGKFQELST